MHIPNDSRRATATCSGTYVVTKKTERKTPICTKPGASEPQVRLRYAFGKHAERRRIMLCHYSFIPRASKKSNLANLAQG